VALSIKRESSGCVGRVSDRDLVFKFVVGMWIVWSGGAVGLADLRSEEG
jgi:hypothetical protein